MIDKRLNTVARSQQPVEGFESTELFGAMADGQIDVLIRTLDESKSNIIVTNKTDKPLAINMPATFSAVPVMRQLGGGGGFGGGGQGGRGGGQNGQNQQAIGGGIGGGQGGGGFGGGGGGIGGGGGGGVFNIPAGRDGKISVRTVCLEHGTPNPRPQIDYRVAPLSEVTSDPQIGEMCRMLANDEIAQPVAQAAAWHVTDGLTWQEMLVKNRVEKMDGYFERFFTPNDLLFAQQVVTVAAQRAEQRAEFESQQSDSDNGDYAVGQ